MHAAATSFTEICKCCRQMIKARQHAVGHEQRLAPPQSATSMRLRTFGAAHGYAVNIKHEAILRRRSGARVCKQRVEGFHLAARLLLT